MAAKVVDYLRDSLTFFGGFIRHPFATGAVLPSSRALARTLLEVGDILPGSTVVEFGPGTGSCTAPILRRIGPGGKLIGFETNERFVEMLRARFPQAVFVHDGAENAAAHLSRLGIEAVDVIVCGLPFATIPPRIQKQIVETAAGILKPQGTFMSFQYCLSIPFPGTRHFRSVVARSFRRYTIKPVWLNIPPAVVLKAAKNGNGFPRS